MADFPTAKTDAVDGVTPYVAKHINNLEDKVGLNSDPTSTSLDYQLNNPASLNPGHKHDKHLLTAVPDDHSYSGFEITLTAHAAVAFGDVCFINASGEAQLIDADAIATMTGCVMAVASINADAAGLFISMGIARDDTWAWTVGGLIYGSVTGTTGNTLTQTQPTGADDVIQILGIATHADRMIFNPQLIQIEHL